MKIGILGGGVAGLSTAIALKQQGFEVEVFERRKSTTQIGAGIVCWPNASFVLEQLGLLDEIESVAGIPTQMIRYSSEGDQLGSLDINELNQLMAYKSYSILRKDLMEVLTSSALKSGVTIRYNHKVRSIKTGANQKANVIFDNGQQIRPDLIIGADGRMQSIARQYVNQDNKPVFQNFVNWIGVFESQEALFPSLSIKDYWGVGSRFGVVPVSATKAYWAGGLACDSIGEKNPETYSDELLSLFHQWPEPITKIINGTPQHQINKIYVHDHHPIKAWHKNNVIVIGDAAHSPLPTSGQGACQALEDSYQLAKIFREYKLLQNTDKVPQFFEHFTELRMSKTTGITLAGRQLANSIFNTDPEFCIQRNLASKKVDYRATILGMAKGWSDALPLNV
ncbi:FAD-dependent monooxygenase [Aliikangiella coralliicola]|uniref:Flavoprotein monooxygenase acting on aromatic compound n=1 Tax=Aliikangiella coralliicola TaxID=2592383 RepID=A0A545UCQ4_9GAMM|nr:FAD-dependent monooxygenase [Aliikangiella coralliicola]TQV87251.1 flavoprotein monooxygenase acting on aromatic compound [Aliikangiella coralliicola]